MDNYHIFSVSERFGCGLVTTTRYSALSFARKTITFYIFTPKKPIKTPYVPRYTPSDTTGLNDYPVPVDVSPESARFGSTNMICVDQSRDL